MKSFFKLSEKNSKKPGKIAIVFLLVLMSFSFLVIQPKSVDAQMVVFDSMNAALTAGGNIWQKTANAFKYLWQKGGSMAFQQTLRTVLNKVAIDSANYVGSGGQGQKPLFITNPWTYVGNLGDEAAGAYLENFASNLSASAGCEQKEKICVQECGNDVTCVGDCVRNKCQTSADIKSTCRKTCTSNYENAYNQGYNQSMVNSQGTVNYDEGYFDSTAAVAERTTCFSACDSAAKSADSGLSNSIATPSFNVCQPSSIDAKLRITLGLAEQSRAQGPDCKATDIVKNWSNLDNYGNSVKALKDLYDMTQGGYNDQVFLNDIQGIFDPRGNDFGIYLTAKTDSAASAADSKLSGTTNLISKGGWLDSLDIAGNTKGLPNQAEINTQQSYKQYSDNFGKYTGDAFVDALNTFLSQTAFTAFNTLMQNLGKTATTGSNSSGSQDYSDPNSNPNLGEGAVKEATAKLNKPDFGSQTNYDILSLLAMCQNEKNPGPTDCVIDNKLMQAITEHKTVIEAVKDGSLNGEWRLTSDNDKDAYTLRNISILRKYMILPVGWEVAIQKAKANNVSIITLNDLLSCFKDDPNYKKFSRNFDQGKQDWCRDLVDPNWVLKAPLNYCRKEGIGGQILTDSVMPGFKGVSGQPDTLSTYNVTRAENYCADEQTCIKEKSNGNCDAYGYCTEEKRTWNFSSDSCQPINNTCRTFNGGASSKTVSYLENTLSYNNCNANSAGCRQYSYYGTYSKGIVSWDQGQSIYFNGSTAFSSCDQSVEGCTGLIRAKSGSGVNLVINSDFSADTVNASSTGDSLNSWPIRGSGNFRKATIVDNNSEPRVSSRALKLEIKGTSIETYSDGSNSSILPTNLQIIPGQAYTLSAEVYLVEGDKAQVTVGSGSDLVSSETNIKNSWQTIKVTRSPKDSFNSPIFSVGAFSTYNANITVFIRNIKFEESNFSSQYSSYGSTGSTKIYEKLLPKYLEASCYVAPGSDSRLKSNNPPELSALCNQFARKCNREEVGCELYSSPANTFNVAAKVSSSDLCPEECLNYDLYIARLDAFSPAQSEKIIPATAKRCSAEEVGCSEFTNLDSLSQGGENKEYYSELKQCIKPSVSDCAAYYAWEGTENGYQLKSYTLKKGSGGGPAVTLSSSEESLKCNSIIYHSSLSSPSYNSDCVEFYNVAGQITYHLASKTITCSENCHSYRLTEKNIDPSILQSQCTGGDRNWDVQNNGCQVCLNGGVWDATHKACLYQAIPNEGKTCQASSKDCREYNGSNGEVVRLISASDFEHTNNWFSNCSNGISINTISNVNNGHSLLYNNSANSCLAIGESGQGGGSSRAPLIKQILADSNIAAQLSVGQSVKQGFAYNISFLAKALQDTSLEVYFYNKETHAKSSFKTVVVTGGNEWQIYKANLENLDHVVSNNEVLVISGNNNFNFDNFVLNEISERYYLIKGTSNVPLSCSFDNFGNNPENYKGEDYNLGCRAYTNRAGQKINLRQFSKLCDESGVGCEQMIDTKNSNSGGAQHVCNGTNCVDVPADETIYAVYDAKKQCNSVDAGCSRLGQLTKTATSTDSTTKYFWADVFKRNNPDKYSSTLCGASSVGCEKWTDEEGASYFKDPGDKTCVYRTATGSSGSGKKWYQSPEKRCDMNKDGKIDTSETSVCLKDSDCNVVNNGATCILDNTDHSCAVSYNKTFGLGGAGNEIPVPNQAGLCEPKESSCTEYVDPVSSFVPNLVYNSSYQPAGTGVKDGWSKNEQTKLYEQTFELEAHKLYIFQVEPAAAGSSISGPTNLSFTEQIQVLSSANTLSAGGNSLMINGAGSILFYTSAFNLYLNPGYSKINVTVTNPNSNKNIVVKPAIVDYQLKTNIDTETKSATCNNGLQPDQGCVGFNERTINGGFGLVTLNTTYGSYTNRLIKVQPDRVCSKWLSCVTYIQESGATTPTCYAVGECDRLSDDNKDCANFISTDNQARTFAADKDKNASGYSLIGNYYFGQMAEVGANSDFHYDFEDLVPYLSCAREGTSTPCSFTNNKNIVKELLVREKVGAPTDYPAHGKSYLKVPAGYLISPQVEGTGVSLIPNSEYYLNFLINTQGGVGGKIHLKYKDKNDKTAEFKDLSSATSTVYTANAGWERKILKFKTLPETATKQYVYRVELGTDPINQAGTAYFDDLNIEPILNTGDNKYVARECRLYPETSSLTCNDSLARDGLEGYCLEHDLKNPAVCSLWYPVDHINSAQTGKAMNGYNGTAPLSYCNQVNGNFSIVEKRVGKMIAYSGYEGSDWDLLYSQVRDDFARGSASLSSCDGILEPDGNSGVYSCLNQETSLHICGSPDYNAVVGWKGNKWIAMLLYCIPKPKDLLVSTIKTVNFMDYQSDITTKLKFREGWAKYNGLNLVNTKYYQKDYPMSDPKLLEAIDEGGIENPIRVIDYNNGINQKESNLEFISGPDPEKNFRLACDSFTQVVDSLGNNKAWSNRVSIASIYPTTTPAFFLDKIGDWYGGNLGLVEKRISHHVNSNFTSKFMAGCDGSNSKDGFNYKDVAKNSAYGTCESYGYPSADYVDFYYEYTTKNGVGVNNGCQGEYWCVPKLLGAKSTSSYGGTYSDIQLSGGPSLLVPSSVSVDGITSTSDGWYLYNGLTVAEANNASPAIRLYDYTVKPAISTEDGLQSISNATEYALSRYGRNRQDAPFGAAVLPDSLDLLGSEGGAVKFRDQYSTKQNETIFAGRPYGCSGNGCMNIGACSLNPDVYCLVDPESLNSTINLNSETCNNGGYGVCVPLWYRRLSSAWINNADYQQILKTLFLKSYTSYSFNAFGYVANTNTYDSVIKACNGSRGPDNQLSSFCAIYPRVTNVKLKLNGQVNGFNSISPRGVYTLEFNTLIDPEQQPLKELQINWDAANSASSDIQTITGQDAKASTSTPHTFYHYYKQSGTKNIEIKATDNWGFFGTSSAQMLDYSS